ncbi:MAG: aldehyde dehydrogenase [Solirubrobacterales bacterium]|nr:aldehyde dehydrogenase [Solirubrobacterales bacterium]MCB0859652.1 aldehyde dehydrogenase [Solirubrobacterales bacterium]
MSVAEIRNPEGTELLGEVELTDPGDVAGVVERAVAARPAWSALPVAERAAMLDRAADLLEPKQEALGRLLSKESGKPIGQAEFEVGGGIHFLRGNAIEGRRLVGRVLPTEGNFGTEWDLAYTRREPLGVVAAILPFNFPVELFVEKCAAALVGGNAVVVKPPVEDPLVVEQFREALIEAGVPSDAIGAVYGDAEVGAALAGAPGVDAISLTGSTAAGIAVATATAARLPFLHLELGGNNACLVLDDADLDLVAGEILRGRVLMNGQACSASKRVIVDRSIHDELAARMSGIVAAQKVGPAPESETTIGPLIHQGAAEKVAAQVANARNQGAEVAAGSGEAEGAYFAPTLLAGVPHSADVAIDDEIFGPVFNLIPVDGQEQAIEVANSSSFGLMGSVFSADPQRALAVAEVLESGGVVINGTDNYRPPVIPFGGVKLSGRGVEGIGYTLEEMTREKPIIFRRFREPRG